MDDYSARGSIDDKLHARLSTDTWMRLSAARSSVASLELGNHEQNLVHASASPTQTRSEIHLSSDSSSEEDVHECISNAGKWLLFNLFIVISQNLAQPFLQENLQLLQCSAPSSAEAAHHLVALADDSFHGRSTGLATTLVDPSGNRRNGLSKPVNWSIKTNK
jgi:hypothetical protein